MAKCTMNCCTSRASSSQNNYVDHAIDLHAGLRALLVSIASKTPCSNNSAIKLALGLGLSGRGGGMSELTIIEDSNIQNTCVAIHILNTVPTST